MKKIIAIILTVVLLFSLTACGAPALPTFTANWGMEDVYEKSTYKITIDGSEQVLDPKAPRLSGEGTYTTLITGGTTDGYKIETTMNFVGKYTLEDKSTVEVNDTVTSYVNFNNLIHKFKPTSSYKKYEGKTVVFEQGNYSIDDLNYESTITYGEDDAIVKTAQKGTSGAYDTQLSNLPLEFEVSVPKGDYVYDNDQLFYMLRSFVKSEGATLSCSIFSGTSASTIAMGASIQAGGITELDTTINDVTAKTKAYVVSLRKSSSSNAGSPQNLFYAIGDTGEVNNATNGTKAIDRSRLIRITQLVPYSYDIMNFDLIGYQYGEIAE